MIRCQLPVINKLGLHARAATKLASAAAHHQCTVRTGKDAPPADPRSHSSHPPRCIFVALVTRHALVHSPVPASGASTLEELNGVTSQPPNTLCGWVVAPAAGRVS